MNRRVTMSDVAKRVNMSRATVSAVLGNKEHCFASEKTKVLIRETAEKMGYTPNLLARGLKNGRTSTIGLIECSMQNEVKQQEVVQYTNLLGERDYRLYVSYTKGEVRLLRLACEDLLARGCDALIISGRIEPADFRMVEEITTCAVFITNLPPLSWERVICYDYAAGVSQAMEHLHDTFGHRNIRMIGRYWSTFFDDMRVVTFQEMLAKFDLSEENPIRIVNRVAEVTPDFMRDFFAESPDCTAIFCSNDLLAMRVIQSCSTLGITVPEDLSLIGFDDIESSSYSTPALTTIRHPLEEGAHEIFKLLMNMLENENEPVCHRLPAQLIIRESCDTPRRKKLKLN